MDTPATTPPIDAAVEAGAPRSAGRTSALPLDDVLAEVRRRVRLYRSAPRGTNPDKADALEALLWWAEAQR